MVVSAMSLSTALTHSCTLGLKSTLAQILLNFIFVTRSGQSSWSLKPTDAASSEHVHFCLGQRDRLMMAIHRVRVGR